VAVAVAVDVVGCAIAAAWAEAEGEAVRSLARVGVAAALLLVELEGHVAARLEEQVTGRRDGLGGEGGVARAWIQSTDERTSTRCIERRSARSSAEYTAEISKCAPSSS